MWWRFRAALVYNGTLPLLKAAAGAYQESGMLTGLFVAVIGLGALCCLAGLLVGYLGLLSTLFPEKLRTREISTVITADLWHLRMCRFRRGRTEGEPVLLVHGMCANHHNFTEPQGACLVDYLVERGYDCWALDLRGTRSSKAPFERDPMDVHLDDYLLYDLPAAIEHVRRATGYARIHYVGHSLGGMLLYAYAQEFGAAQIASSVTLGAPLGFDGVRPRVGLALLPFVKRFPLFAADFLRGLLPIVAPLRLPVPVFPLNGRNVHSGLKVSHFYNMIDIPQPNVMSELAHMLKRRVWRMKNDTLDVKAGLEKMDFPLLAIYGAKDPFVPVEVARQFVEKLPHDDKQILVCSQEQGCKFDHGHCDLAFAVDGARTVFKPIADWFANHPIKERLSHSAEVEANLMTPLDEETRANVLSGETFQSARGGDALLMDVEEPQPAVFPEEQSALLKEREAMLRGISRDEAEAPAPKARRVPAKPKAAPAKPAPKAKAAAPKAAAKKAAAKPTANAVVSEMLDALAAPAAPKKAAAKPKAAAAKAGPESKPAAKATAKAKPAARKAPAAAKTAAKPKAAPSAKPSAKSTSSTLDVLRAASEDLKKLDKVK